MDSFFAYIPRLHYSLNFSLDTIDETYSTYIISKLSEDDMLPRSIGSIVLAVEIYSSSHLNGPPMNYLRAIL